MSKAKNLSTIAPRFTNIKAGTITNTACKTSSGEYISEWSSGASVTYTDSDLNTTTRQYRARAVVNAFLGTQRNKALTIVSAKE
jgi:hypothetical protein